MYKTLIISILVCCTFLSATAKVISGKKISTIERYGDENDEENDVVVIVLNEQFKEILKSAERPDGVIDPLNLVNGYLRDPMAISDFSASEDGAFAKFDTSFTNMSMKGLKTLDLSSMRFNLGLMQAQTVLTIPALRLDGQYKVDGKLVLVPVNGKGNFHMDVEGLKMVANAELKRKPVTEELHVGEMTLDLTSDDIHVQFDNLMGGRRWSKLSNSILNQIAHLVFDHIKQSLLAELQTDVQTYLDTKLPEIPTEFVHKRSASLFDDIMDKVREELVDAKLDPIDLPDQREAFSHDLGFVKATGEAKLYNGILTGLSTLVRTGDVIADYTNHSVTLEANMGFQNLTGSYDWRLRLFGGGPGGLATLNVNQISCFVKLRQGLRRGARPVIDEFKINGIKTIYVDITGLGTWDFIFEFIFNLVSNAFKNVLAWQISDPIKEALQHQLDQLPSNFFI
jgi:hypothetical protein